MDAKRNFQQVGTMKSDTKGKGRYFLTIRIPFFPLVECSALPNENKEEANHPDYLIFQDSNKIGSLYKNEDKNGKIYLSGKIFCMASPSSFLPLFCFENVEKSTWEIKIPYDSEK